MKTFILGGVRSGKSRLAETLAKQSNQQVVYIATATAGDAEMQARIQSHIENRPKNWIVVEESLNLSATIEKYSNKNYCILIDCLTLWLTNLLLCDDDVILSAQCESFKQSLDDCNDNIIIVSNETGLGIMPLGELSRRYGDEAGVMNQSVAAICDRVVLTVAGLPLTLKGIPL